MTITEIVPTRPLAAGIAVGILLDYGSLVPGDVFVYTREDGRIHLEREIASQS
jgi:hypothetical protein